jgi:5-methylcytosine-specific restriction protein A
MEGFIHVHHIKPLAKLGSNYKIDPIKDLRPVCPNCHAVLHRKDFPYSLDEVVKLLEVYGG